MNTDEFRKKVWDGWEDEKEKWLEPWRKREQEEKIRQADAAQQRIVDQQRWKTEALEMEKVNKEKEERKAILNWMYYTPSAVGWTGMLILGFSGFSDGSRLMNTFAIMAFLPTVLVMAFLGSLKAIEIILRILFLIVDSFSKRKK